MPKVTLYHTEGCHLCEQAYEMLLRQYNACDIEMKDIVDDETLMAKFQTTIPVIEANGQSLNWPFSLTEIKQIL